MTIDNVTELTLEEIDVVSGGKVGSAGGSAFAANQRRRAREQAARNAAIIARSRARRNDVGAAFGRRFLERQLRRRR